MNNVIYMAHWIKSSGVKFERRAHARVILKFNNLRRQPKTRRIKNEAYASN
jgi:hypothetical protein